jgi:hypothetical protein
MCNFSCIYGFETLVKASASKYHTFSDLSSISVLTLYLSLLQNPYDRLCSLVVRVPGYRSGGPGSIDVATRFSLRSRSGTGSLSIQPREYN